MKRNVRYAGVFGRVLGVFCKKMCNVFIKRNIEQFSSHHQHKRLLLFAATAVVLVLVIVVVVVVVLAVGFPS